MRLRPLAIVLLATLVASGCRVHLVGDSTAAFVQAYAADAGYTITGTPAAGCGFTAVNGNRIAPGASSGGYPSCTIDWVNAALPDDPDDIVFAFVSLHDAMCSTIDGCLAPDVAAYGAADTHIRATGHGVVWVETPPLGNQQLQDRIAALNAAVAVELGCALVPYDIRVAATYDGIHYVRDGGREVAARLALHAEDPTLC